MLLPEARIAHQGDRRTRLRIPSKRRDISYFSRCEKELANLPGIIKVQGNALTGSLLIAHETEVTRFAAVAAERELFQLAPGETLTEHLGTLVSQWDEQLKQATHGRVDLRTAAFLTLVALGIVQLMRGHPLQAAGSLFIDAVGLVILSTNQTRSNAPGLDRSSASGSDNL
jgi:Heavy metal associated domain 2